MALTVSEVIVATGRITGEEKVQLLLKDGLELNCTAIAGTSARNPKFCLDESSWTPEMRQEFRDLTEEWTRDLPQGRRAPRERFILITSALEHSVPLELKLNAAFGHDPQLRSRSLTLAPIIGIELI